MPVNHLVCSFKRKSYAFILLLVLLLLLGFAGAIPFVWESTSLWYKTGTDKLVLQLGKVCGLFAAVLFFLQVVLVQRLVILDRIFGLDKLYSYHRINSLVFLILAIAHAALVVLPEGLDNLPIGWDFWPEMLGALLVVMLTFFIGVAYYRRKFLAYHLWRLVHRPVGFLLVILLAIHVFNVSDSFEAGPPKIALWGLIAFILLTIILAKILLTQKTIKQLPVTVGLFEDAKVISLRVTVPSSFSFAPGQFAFLQLHGESISGEYHPFTIASAPTMSDQDSPSLEFLIKQCGDWTNSIMEGDSLQASITGPFGLFSYLARPLPPMIIFIGGGIGITPLLSMLRHLSGEKHPPETRLIWSVSKKNDTFLNDELGNLREKFANLQTHLIYTREAGGHRLDQKTLGTLLDQVPRESHFYVCGPEAMMEQVQQDLQELGFAKSLIFREQFSL